MGLSQERAQQVLSNLTNCGLLKEVDGQWVPAQMKVRTTEDVRSEALRQSHVATLEMGISKLGLPLEQREFSCSNFAVNKEKIDEAKTIIREFRLKMETLLKDQNSTEVFQLAIQFYPLTQID